MAATVAGVVRESSRATTLQLDVTDWSGHRAGQHVDVRLTAADGYQAHRSYSIASAPGSRHVEVTIVRFDDGEVSPHLVDVADVGDQIEVRGPIGGWFVWDGDDGVTPVQLVGGGSGVVPLVAMLRHHARRASCAPMRLLYSARAFDDVIYRLELDELAAGDGRDVTVTLTREVPAGWTGPRGRIGAEMLAAIGWPPRLRPTCYVCGASPFVEAVSRALVALGHDSSLVRTQRFGPTGA